ncbi:MAG: hypothetical protein KJ000_20340 [Pirellulaceae bacterium]|nr:hypothetical protein [Pirellulaceae bacterium]
MQDASKENEFLASVLGEVAHLQRKATSGDPWHLGDAHRLKTLIKIAPKLRELVRDTVCHRGTGAELALVRWCTFLGALPKIMLQAGRQVGVDLSPVAKVFDAWRNNADLDGPQVASMEIDARTAMMQFEGVLPEDPEQQEIPLDEAVAMMRSILDEPVTTSPPPAAESVGGISATGEKLVATRRPDPLVGLLDDIALKVLHIAEKHELDADTRLQAISALDQRFWGKQSPELGELLNLDASRIRQTEWWRVDRPRHLAPDKEPATQDDL